MLNSDHILLAIFIAICLFTLIYACHYSNKVKNINEPNQNEQKNHIKHCRYYYYRYYMYELLYSFFFTYLIFTFRQHVVGVIVAILLNSWIISTIRNKEIDDTYFVNEGRRPSLSSEGTHFDLLVVLCITISSIFGDDFASKSLPRIMFNSNPIDFFKGLVGVSQVESNVSFIALVIILMIICNYVVTTLQNIRGTDAKSEKIFEINYDSERNKNKLNSKYKKLSREIKKINEFDKKLSNHISGSHSQC